MSAFLIKHSTYGKYCREPLANIISALKARPYSLTSIPGVSQDAIGHYVYVVEVRLMSGKTTYWLGYKYKSEKRELSKEPEFKYMNVAGVPPVGIYFTSPARIHDADVLDWLKHKQGMIALPSEISDEFDSMFSAGANSF